MLLELAHLRLAQRGLVSPVAGPLFARLSRKPFFAAQMRGIVTRQEAFGSEEIDALWFALAREDGRARLPAISRYIEERRRFRNRWIGALERLDLPLHLLWGEDDPIAVTAIAEAVLRLAPHARLTRLPGLGHYPMLEDPRRYVAELSKAPV
jgi:pimeloyl-ACP methyl ester carboxylesterase